MDLNLRDTFISLWKKYFGNADLPITLWYTYADGGANWADKPKGWSCIICQLARVREGWSLTALCSFITSSLTIIFSLPAALRLTTVICLHPLASATKHLDKGL